MEKLVKEIRVQIDGLAKATALLMPSRETSLAKTHFEESKMSLGKVLGYMGAANPYPESKNPNSPVIEKTADTGAFKFSTNNHVEQVKTVRMVAEDAIQRMKVINVEDRVHECELFLDDAFLQCHKGMMWLGMELGRIKDLEDSAAQKFAVTDEGMLAKQEPENRDGK